MTEAEYRLAIREAKANALGVEGVCASCEWLMDDGLCSQYNQYPPLEDITRDFGCDRHLERIPF